ncbi:MAG: HD domain-containing protein, partial [Nitrospirae bacterium]|nr:HD domain-containing protein [Nitrospirota bacterium]
MKDRLFEEKRGSLGKEFINNLHILFKTAIIHDLNNVALNNTVDKAMESINLLFVGGDSFSLRLVQEYLFIDDVKIKVDIENFLASMFLMEEMKKRGIGSITFSVNLSTDELKRFVYAFISTDPKSPEPFEGLINKLLSLSVTHFTINRLKEEVEDFDHVLEDTREMAKRIYFKTISVASDIMESAKLKSSSSIKRAKRLMQSMVDLMLQEESTLLGLTTLRAYDEYTYNHSVNVSILSIAMGQRLGYHRRELGELGMATLFHDIGKIELPLELLNKPTEFTQE